MSENIESKETIVTEPSPEVEKKPTKEEKPAKVYSQAELDSFVSSAVNKALDKERAKSSKTTDERLKALEDEIHSRDLRDYARTACRENDISADLESLFYGSDQEDIDAKIQTFKSYYNDAVEHGVKSKLSEVQAPTFQKTASTVSSARTSLADRQKAYDSKHK